jgi:hypothetical protein
MRYSVNFHIYGGSTYATIVVSYSSLHLFFLAVLNRTEPKFSDKYSLDNWPEDLGKVCLAGKRRAQSMYSIG